MKIKKILIFLTIVLASICLFSFSNTVKAMTISEEGKYALVLSVMDGDINGEYYKIIRFNVEDGETTVKLSELTKEIVPFNNENEFSHWEKFGGVKASEELAISDFTSSGKFGDESYTNGLVLDAIFSDKLLQGTGTYYLTLDPFAGKINGKANIRLTSKSTEYKTVDLTKYTPTREGYTFVGWAFNGKFVTSIDSSYFADRDCVTVTATYTKDVPFDEEGDYIHLTLNANGGTIDGKASNKYDYVGGGNSGTSMSIFQYVPKREGYTFNGWNTKKDGTGKNYKYVYWAFWRNDESSVSEFERDTIIEEKGMYKNLTLYASWTKNSGTPTTPEQPTKDTVKEIQNDGEIKTNIEFANEVSKNYRLDIQKVEIKEELANKNVKFIADINVLDGNTVVKISDTKMKIRIALPEELKGYNKYEVVYILNDEIKETIPATVEDGYIVFETSHLSQYGIIATNVEENKTNNETNNPKTADNIMTSVMLFAASIIAIGGLTLVNRKK